MMKGGLLIVVLLLVGFASSARIFDRIFLVLFENQDLAQVRANAYFSSLEKKGMLCTNYHAMTHPSQGNYIALIGGSIRGVTDDANYDIAGESLVDLLERRGISWKSYNELYPRNCYAGSSSSKYVRKHNPFISFNNIRSNSSRCSKIVEAAQLDVDIKANKLPQYSFFTPDLNNDGHDTSISYSATWLQEFFSDKLTNKNFTDGTLIVVTYDESSRSGGNLIYTVLLGDYVYPGSIYTKPITHTGLLATVEDNWNLGNLGFEDASADSFDPTAFKPYGGGGSTATTTSKSATTTTTGSTTTSSPQVLLAYGSAWNFTAAYPSAPPAMWHTTSLNQNGWSRGTAPFGYGDTVTYGTTLIDNDGGYYFVSKVTVTQTSSYGVQVLSRCDNGCDIWVDGTQVVFDAGNDHEYTAVRTTNVALSNTVFSVGSHYIYVYVNNTGSSSDAYMDVQIQQFIGSTTVGGSTSGASATTSTGSATPTPIPTPTPLQVFIDYGGSWKYSTAFPTTAPSNWPTASLDTTSWRIGSGPFGYGDNTIYGTSLADNNGTYYFVKKYTISSRGPYSVRLLSKCDNGCDVWIDGSKVLSDAINDHEYTVTTSTTVSNSLAAVGNHTMFVLLSNTKTSSDAYMAIQMEEY